MNTETLITIAGIVLASSGLWKFIETVWTNTHQKQTAEDKLLLGLAFNRIIEICHRYIDQGSIDIDEYKELKHYLFTPYKEAGGNGTAERLIHEVEKLPLRMKGE